MHCDIVERGLFKRELKNRFLCIVEIDGCEVLCYIPSSCKLSNFIDMADRTVLLRPIQSAKSRTQYEVFAVQIGRKFVVLHLSTANSVVFETLNSRRFSFLGERKNIKKEHQVEGYRCDAFIEDTNTVIEVKSILSLNNTAIFPTVFSQRAIDQLKKIDHLLDMGYRACYIFVSMNPGISELKINDEMDQYYKLLNQCAKKGLIIKGYSLKYKDGLVTINKTIKVDF